MTSDESQLRIQKLRFRMWFHIVFAAVYASGALFFAIQDAVLAALILIGFAGLSAIIISRSVEELSRLKPPNAKGDEVDVRLTHDEALVLFDWLHRSEDVDGPAPVEHPAEQVALWNLSALLERHLIDPLTSDYALLVEAARKRLGAAD